MIRPDHLNVGPAIGFVLHFLNLLIIFILGLRRVFRVERLHPLVQVGLAQCRPHVRGRRLCTLHRVGLNLVLVCIQLLSFQSRQVLCRLVHLVLHFHRASAALDLEEVCG